MAHRVGVMAGGRLAQVGTPAQIYERPASRFVAEFVGAANVLAGEIGSDGTFLVPSPGLRVRTAWTPAHAVRPGPALLAVRPERIRLGENTNRIEGHVHEIAYAGQTVTYLVRVGDGAMLRVMQPLSTGFDPARHPVGAGVTLGFEPEACIVLPPE